MIIQKSKQDYKNKEKCVDCYDDAINHIKCAIDTLTKDGNSKNKKQTVEAVANLSVIIFDLQNKRG